MKKKLLCVALIAVFAFQLTACSLEPTCKADGCEETELYEDGYCKYHYYLQSGENLLKDIIN